MESEKVVKQYFKILKTQLTIREYARIRSFPNEWIFNGSLSQQYRQIGNAVPVNLAFHLGQSVRDILEDTTSDYSLEIEPISNNDLINMNISKYVKLTQSRVY